MEHLLSPRPYILHSLLFQKKNKNLFSVLKMRKGDSRKMYNCPRSCS